MLAENSRKIHCQIAHIMKNGANLVYRGNSRDDLPPVKIVNNYEWQREIKLLDFLDQIGSQMRLAPLLSREGVQRRLASGEGGMSFTEFCYQLLQGYDFYHLLRHHQCQIQLGGSDQWGNMVAGVEMIGRLLPRQADQVAIITFPLLTVGNEGVKMGKSEGNAVWLDPQLTSPFDLYQYFLRLSDADALLLLSRLTFMSLEQLDNLRTQHQALPEQRLAHKKLAYEVTAFVHGASEAADAVRATHLLFEAYDTALQVDVDRQLIAKTLKQSRRHLQLSITSDLSFHGLLKQILSQHDYSNSKARWRPFPHC